MNDLDDFEVFLNVLPKPLRWLVDGVPCFNNSIVLKLYSLIIGFLFIVAWSIFTYFYEKGKWRS